MFIKAQGQVRLVDFLSMEEQMNRLQFVDGCLELGTYCVKGQILASACSI